MDWIKRHKAISITSGIAILLIAVVGAFLLTNKVAPISTGWWGPVNSESGVAIRGYDPVTFHTQSAAQPGQAAYTHSWNGVTWQFVSEENQKAFANNPEKYAPAYGGYCARAVLAGFTADANPQIFHVHEGSVYLFVDQGPLDEWKQLALAEGQIGQGDANWAERP